MKKQLLMGMRFRDFAAPGSLGVVQNVIYIQCYWPKLDGPTNLFAEGSSGIEVMGNPTPRNVLFPEDTVFRDYFPDALYPAECEVYRQFPGRRNLMNMAENEAQVWFNAYEVARHALPETAAVHSTKCDCYFMRERREKSRRVKTLAEDSHTLMPDGSIQTLKAGAQIEKIEFDEFVADVPAKDCRKPHSELMKMCKTKFRHISEKVK